MAYRGRKRYRPRRTRRRRGRKGFEARVKDVILSLAELKTHSIAANDTAISTTGAFYDLLPVGEGTATYQRVGDKIEVKQTWLSAYCELSATDAFNNFRIMLVGWNSSADLNSLPDLLESTANGEYLMVSEYQRERETGFHVYIDRIVKVTTDNPVKNVKLFKKWARRPYEIPFTGVATTDAGPKRLYWVIISDSAVASHPTITFKCSTRFYDI